LSIVKGGWKSPAAIRRAACSSSAIARVIPDSLPPWPASTTCPLGETAAARVEEPRSSNSTARRRQLSRRPLERWVWTRPRAHRQYRLDQRAHHLLEAHLREAAFARDLSPRIKPEAAKRWQRSIRRSIPAHRRATCRNIAPHRAGLVRKQSAVKSNLDETIRRD